MQKVYISYINSQWFGYDVGDKLEILSTGGLYDEYEGKYILQDCMLLPDSNMVAVITVIEHRDYNIGTEFKVLLEPTGKEISVKEGQRPIYRPVTNITPSPDQSMVDVVRLNMRDVIMPISEETEETLFREAGIAE